MGNDFSWAIFQAVLLLFHVFTLQEYRQTNFRKESGLEINAHKLAECELF